MSDTKDMIFSANELVAISIALESQIEDCEKYLSDPSFTIAEKNNINQVMQHSKSAAARLDKILEKNNIKSF